ncbi:MAG: hypothetical protein KDI19_04085 [Pseudomonadales bacterium]|nr:hypothetical protein [Pseudomonadales bacterium]
MPVDPALKVLPAHKQEAIEREFGNVGREWIAGFGELVETCAARWSLELDSVASAGYPINVVFFGRRGGQDVVLKVGHPHPEQVTEMVALRCYAGRHAAALIDCSEELGATLMARVHPGRTFRETAQSIERSFVPIDLFATLPIALASHERLPTFSDWLEKAFAEFRQKFRSSASFYRHVERAERLYPQIEARDPGKWLLHGDLHHENILVDDETGFRAIDPKGVIGPKSMECGRFIHNFLEDEVPGASTVEKASLESLAEVVRTRVETLSPVIHLPPRHMIESAYVDATMSFVWTINAGLPWEADVKRIEAVEYLLDETVL